MKQLYKILLIAFSLITSVSFAFAESYQVQGVVLSDDGEPLTGAVITTDGHLPTAVVTGIDGRFTIVVDDSCTSLEVTYLGFEGKVVQLTALTEYSITLTEDSVGLSEVVVVGYAVQRRESVVGAIGSISGDDILGNKGDTSLTNALDGLIPGVTLIQSSGEPGSSTSEILIRGKSSWVNNDPLVLVDGIERDFDDIDPNDVQSISVLKDASATAVFGVKGANGVILVTLKEGEKGSAKIKFSSSVSLRQPISTYDLLSTAETLSLYNEALANQGVYDPSLYYSQEVIDKYATQSDPYLYPDVDWADELLRDVAVTQKYNVSVSGGKDKVKYYNSLSYSREGDIFNSEEQEYYDPRYTYKRFNYVSNLVFDLTQTTKVKLALTGSSATKTASSYSSSDLMNDITNRSPSYIFPAYYEDGTMGDYLTSGTSNNPIALLNYLGATRTRTNKAYIDLIIDQDLGMITQGLSAGAKVSYNNVAVYKQTVSNKFDGSLNVIRYYYYEADDGTIQREVYPDENYQLLVPTFESESLNSYQRDFYYEASLKYNRGFNRHRVGALALFQRRVDYSNADFRLPTEDWVARVEYAYDGRYMLEASGSYNGSDKFAEGNRFGFFPAIAVGWMISRERFVTEHLPFIDEFKIRYSYGKVGSDLGASSSSDYAYQQNWMYMRIATLMLDYAEAVNEVYGVDVKPTEGDYTALELVNMIRSWSGHVDVHSNYTTDATTFGEKIRNERFVELCFEHVRWFDLRRWGVAHEDTHRKISRMTLDSNGDYEVQEMSAWERIFQSKHYWYPISLNDVNMLENMEQNPGW
ncbi:MAG: SusC/RagA family TonB-linked outer membrane protein [Rikenellaceae bacterium]